MGASISPHKWRTLKAKKVARGMVEASAYGSPDADRWLNDALALRINTLRLTNLFEESSTAAFANAGDKLGEQDRKVKAALSAGMDIVVDLSWIRNLLVKEGINPYFLSERELKPYVEIALQQPFPDGSGRTYAQAPEVAYVGLWGEPLAEYGDDNPVQQAKSASQLRRAYQTLARVVRDLGYDGPIAAGGFNHLSDDGKGADGGLQIDKIAGLPEIDILTIHGYGDQHHVETTARLYATAAWAHRNCKPCVLEEIGFAAEDFNSDSLRALEFTKLATAVRFSSVDGIGLWNIGQYNGYDVRPAGQPKAAAAWRDAVAALPVPMRGGVAVAASSSTPSPSPAPGGGSGQTMTVSADGLIWKVEG